MRPGYTYMCIRERREGDTERDRDRQTEESELEKRKCIIIFLLPI